MKVDVTSRSPEPVAVPADRAGRRPVTSRGELERTALELFAERGFEATTVDDIAAAAGIGRRTFFRYFRSKNDVPWGDFDAELARMRMFLRGISDDVPVMDGLRAAVVDFNRLDPEEVPRHRHRMDLILRVPALQAHSTLMYAAWRAVVAEYVARRLDQPENGLVPQAVAYSALGACVAAYEQWLAGDGEDLGQLLDHSLEKLGRGFDLR